MTTSTVPVTPRIRNPIPLSAWVAFCLQFVGAVAFVLALVVHVEVMRVAIMVYAFGIVFDIFDAHACFGETRFLFRFAVDALVTPFLMLLGLSLVGMGSIWPLAGALLISYAFLLIVNVLGDWPNT